ncbi:MAG: AtpZ/AtpI family protein [Acidobacteriota bacterium]
MGDKTHKPPVVPSGVETDNVVAVVQTIGDTTWRMFVPTVGFTLLGVWLDGLWNTKPWLMIAGIAVGVLGSVLLVREQLRRVKRGGK